MPPKSQARRAAARSARGERVLPGRTTSRARKAASFISDIPPRDRDAVIDIKMHGWWDNGKSMDNPRKFYPAEDIYLYGLEMEQAGVPANTINIVRIGPDAYRLYADRES